MLLFTSNRLSIWQEAGILLKCQISVFAAQRCSTQLSRDALLNYHQLIQLATLARLVEKVDRQNLWSLCESVPPSFRIQLAKLAITYELYRIASWNFIDGFIFMRSDPLYAKYHVSLTYKIPFTMFEVLPVHILFPWSASETSLNSQTVLYFLSEIFVCVEIVYHYIANLPSFSCCISQTWILAKSRLFKNLSSKFHYSSHKV